MKKHGEKISFSFFDFFSLNFFLLILSHIPIDRAWRALQNCIDRFLSYANIWSEMSKYCNTWHLSVILSLSYIPTYLPNCPGAEGVGEKTNTGISQIRVRSWTYIHIGWVWVRANIHLPTYVPTYVPTYLPNCPGAEGVGEKTNTGISQIRVRSWTYIHIGWVWVRANIYLPTYVPTCLPTYLSTWLTGKCQW
jgi:hypothetical protein